MSREHGTASVVVDSKHVSQMPVVGLHKALPWQGALGPGKPAVFLQGPPTGCGKAQVPSMQSSEQQGASSPPAPHAMPTRLQPWAVLLGWQTPDKQVPLQQSAFVKQGVEKSYPPPAPEYWSEQS